MKKLPLIATRGVVIFPGHSTRMDVGRKISLNAIDIALLKNEGKILLVSQKDINKDQIKDANDLFKIGTMATIQVEQTLATGAKTVVVKGLERVSITNLETNNNQMIEADYKVLKSVEASEKEEKSFINVISSSLDKAMSGMMNIPKDVLSSLASGISADELTNIIGHYLPIRFEKKQQLLETLKINKRLEFALKFLNEENQISDLEKDIDKNVRKTIDSQHKEFLLRERMKAIKEELGDISSKDNVVDKWRKELESKKFPNRVKEQIGSEIDKYETTPPMAAESNIIKGYLDLIFSLPWETFSQDNEELNKAKKILDKHHYGLKKVKERIIEHLAVKMNTKSSSSPIITLVGPPGVGKTSLAQSIAEAVGREFVKVSLGGVKDESEIRGHRRTYVGAMPGKIIQAIKKAKTSNPVILLDEIDKMSSDFKGDPTSAMLEVLDPEQNKLFQDHYLELEYDLSNVMFLATANFYEQIPGPLLDRVEIINLDQYTSEEKLAIAKSYIIPKVLKENGLKKPEFKINDDVLEYVIAKYTYEAGVRGLQRILSKLARKIVVLKLEGKVQGQKTIDKKTAKHLLGKEQVYKEPLKGKAEVGVVNGMYYSSVGGGVLPIEVTTFPSKSGGIKITGSIKEVMQESLNIALGYIRTNQKKFGINFDWENNKIQIHVPAGATPKDGPSAGIAFATALISSLKKKPISKEIALTGEITLRGNVLPIGGLKEKSLGAVEAGVKKIFIPKVNERDYEELAKKVKDVAEIIPVNKYEEIFETLF